MKGRIAAIVMAVVLAIYLVLVGQRAVMFVLTGEPIAVVIGVTLIALPLVGAWALGRELWFGVRTEQLVERMDREGELPPDDLPKRTSGRPEREAADADFARWKDAVELDETSWRAWFRLGLAYDASGDRRRARAALRSAVRLEGAERRAGTGTA